MIEYSPENLPQITPEGCEGHDDAISNRQRRALRGPSVSERRDAARRAQIASGIRIRIARRVKNQLDFKEQRKQWHSAVEERTAVGKGIGSFAMTVFDTAQQPLRFVEDCTKEEWEDKLRRACPGLFAESPPIAVAGVRLFGKVEEEPFIGLFLAPGMAFDEKRTVRHIVAPELWLDDSHQLEDQPHVSLGQASSREQAEEIQRLVVPLAPTYVQFRPATIEVTRITNSLRA